MALYTSAGGSEGNLRVQAAAGLRRQLGVRWVARLRRLGPAEGLDSASWPQNEFGGAQLGDKRLPARLMHSIEPLRERPGRLIAGGQSSGAADIDGYYRFIERPGPWRTAPRSDGGGHPAPAPGAEHAAHEGAEGGAVHPGRQRPAVRDAAGLHGAGGVVLRIRDSEQVAGGQVAALDRRLPGHLVGGGQADAGDAGDRGDGPGGGFLGTLRRAAQEGAGSKLFVQLGGGPAGGYMNVEVAGLTGRPKSSHKQARVGCELRNREVVVPATKAGGEPAVLLGVHVVETDQPQGEKKGLQWHLLTSLPVRNAEEAEEAVSRYRC